MRLRRQVQHLREVLPGRRELLLQLLRVLEPRHPFLLGALQVLQDLQQRQLHPERQQDPPVALPQQLGPRPVLLLTSLVPAPTVPSVCQCLAWQARPALARVSEQEELVMLLACSPTCLRPCSVSLLRSPKWAPLGARCSSASQSPRWPASSWRATASSRTH